MLSLKIDGENGGQGGVSNASFGKGAVDGVVVQNNVGDAEGDGAGSRDEDVEVVSASGDFNVISDLTEGDVGEDDGAVGESNIDGRGVRAQVNETNGGIAETNWVVSEVFEDGWGDVSEEVGCSSSVWNSVTGKKKKRATG